ncbi:acyltransferase [Thermoanaerobacterium sp. RBIITD]|uniref:acyltransferase n=1 Tax=Thermoanaerobacterium sp. RBIITD TaxID=1550240 RepID=UPI000BB97E66|nr:acyltransferase [Thermoanaerobacterium sp. RBIITD]SNX53595.1 Surface polysaccharide O-acyltransferase, integral membrane enzyme [Thermoanaerobacterium sp. RBIITD]
MTKSRINEIDILKGIAIISVLMIHTTSNAVVVLNKTSISYFILASINRLTQFAVPAFIFASAMLLMYNYGDKHDWGVFYKRRFKNVLFPYISWTIIYGAYLIVRYHMPLKSILTVKNLLLGGMFYHMYFIVIIVQLYLLFPIILYIYKFINKNFYTVASAIILFQIADILIFKYLIYKYFQNSSVLFITYISYIIAGMYIGENIPKWKKYYTKEGLITLFIALITGYLFVDISLKIFINKPVNLNLYNIYWYTFTLTASLFFMALSTQISRYHRLSSFLINTGKLSFGIYLIHPLILDILMHFLKTGKPLLFDIYTGVAFVIIFIVSYFITKILKKIPWGAIIVGK